MKNDTVILAILGYSGSGKDTILRELLKDEKYNGVVSNTTRPMRENEVDGVDYNFKTEKEFFNFDYIEIIKYREWYFGTPKNSFVKDKLNIMAIDHNRFMNFKESGYNIHSIFLYVDESTRLSRIKERGDYNYKEAKRRLKNDTEQFLNYNGTVVQNYNIEETIKEIKQEIILKGL